MSLQETTTAIYRGASLHSMTDWRTPGLKARCAALWDDKFSAAQIAKTLNDEFDLRLSRNAIIGYAHRHGLPARRTRNPATPKPPREKRDKPKTRSQYNAGDRAPLPFMARKLPEDFRPLNIPFLTLQANQCRDVVCEYGEDGLAVYCGHPIVEGFSYCADHKRVNYMGFPR